MRPPDPISLALLLLAAMPGAPACGKTAHVRGPSYDGHFDETVLALPWSTDGPGVLWRRRLGDGFSGIVVADGRVFSQVQTLAGQYVVCLDLLSGREIWRTRYNWPWQPESDWPGPYGSPTYRDGLLYFTDCFGRAGCVEARNGRLVWSLDLAKLPGAEIPEFGYAATPLVEGGVVFLPVGGTNCAVVALRAIDGRVLWRSGDAPGSYSSCVWLPVSGRSQVVAFLDGLALGLDPATGGELWRHEWPSEATPHATWPLYEEPLLFHSLPFRRGSRVLRLASRGGGISTEPVWNRTVLSMEMLSGVVVRGFIYGFDLRDFEARTEGGTRGVFKCVDLATGRQRWRSEAVGHAGALASGNRLILLKEHGVLIVAEATPDAYQELARWPVFPGLRCWTAPTPAGRFLVARSRAEFACLDLGAPGGRAASGDEFALRRSARDLPGLRETLSLWFGRHYGRAFYAPNWKDQAWWCAGCLAMILAPALAAGAIRPRSKLVCLVTSVGGLALGAGGTWALTESVGRFVFTWPAALFSGLQLVLLCRAWAIRSTALGPQIVARVALLAFLAFAAGYWFLCRSFFLVVGGGYLVGLLPALPLCLAAANAGAAEGSGWRRAGLMGLAFSVQFLASAAFIAWRT